MSSNPDRPRTQPTPEFIDAPRCSIEGCGRLHYAGGLCQSHLWRRQKHGDVRAEEPIRPYESREGTCMVDGCDGEIKARGMCNKHYRRERYGKRKQAQKAAAAPVANGWGAPDWRKVERVRREALRLA